jgi:hypothetical protein
MKTPILLFAAAALVASASTALADPPGGHPHGGPPGLAKKPHGMPPGQAKKMWRRGERLPSSYYSASRYYIAEPARYRLSAPPPGYRWVLVDGDAYLVRRDNGLVAELVADAVSRLLR